MADLNQGASIEAERELFEAWHRSKFETKHSTGQPTRDMHNGVYAENYGPKDQQLMWEVWQAARRTPADAVGAGELPPLRQPLVATRHGTPCYTVGQILDYGREAIAHYLRKQAGQVGVKTWQQRYFVERTGPGSQDMMMEHMQAEIADLRAQLANAQQAKEYEQRHAAESESALAQAHAELARCRSDAALQEIIDIGQEAGAVADQKQRCDLRLCCRDDAHAPGCTTYDPARYRDEFAEPAGQEGEQPTKGQIA